MEWTPGRVDAKRNRGPLRGSGYVNLAHAYLVVNLLDPHSLLSSFGPIGVGVTRGPKQDQ